MVRNRYWISLVIIVVLSISSINCNAIQQKVNESNYFQDLNSLANELPEVSKGIDSPSNGTNTDYSWTSWSNASDLDNDFYLDTLNVYYNFSNFNLSVYFLIEFSIDIFIEIDGSPVLIDYGSDYFAENVEQNESYLWNFEWHAKEDGNYSMIVSQEVWGEYNTTYVIEENFFWNNIHQFNYLHNYTVSITTSNIDEDSFNDTIEFIYFLNFTSSGHYNLEMYIQIFIWNDDFEEWDYLHSDFDYIDFDVTYSEIVNWTYQYKAWYNGDYKFIITAENDYYGSYPPLLIDVQEWYNAHAFIMINEWGSKFTEIDKDGDNCPDSFSLDYNFTFTFSGEVRLQISIFISFWEDSQWNYFDNSYGYFSDEVIAGEVKQWHFEWNALRKEKYLIEVGINDDFSGFLLISEVFEEIDLCAYEIVNDVKMWFENTDKDQDGTIDSTRLSYGLLFKSTGSMDLVLSVGVQFPGTSYRRHFTSYFQGEVTTLSYYHCYFDFSAGQTGEYTFYVSILTSDGFPILKDEEHTWIVYDIYNPVLDISYSTSETDKDDDGLIDTLNIIFELTFRSSGFVNVIIDIEVESFNTQLNDWIYEFTTTIMFSENIVANKVYEKTFQYSAPRTANYKIDYVAHTDYSAPVLVEEIIYWFGNEFTLFNDFYFSFIPNDRDSDGNNDSLDIQFNFKSPSDQNLLFAFFVEVRSYNEELDRWEYVTSPYEPETNIFQKEVFADTWYSWNYSYGFPFNGTFNLTSQISFPYFNSDAYRDSFLFVNASKFNRIPLEVEMWTVGHDTNQDGFNDTTEIGLNFNFDQTGIIDLNIAIDIISVYDMFDYTNWSINFLMYQFHEEVSSGIWYDWSTNISIDLTLYNVYILRVLDRGVNIFYSIGFFSGTEPEPYVYSIPLLPVVPPESQTTTTNTIPLVTTTTATTTTINITSGWNFVASMFVLMCLILLSRYRKFKKQ